MKTKESYYVCVEFQSFLKVGMSQVNMSEHHQGQMTYVMIIQMHRWRGEAWELQIPAALALRGLCKYIENAQVDCDDVW